MGLPTGVGSRASLVNQRYLQASFSIISGLFYNSGDRTGLKLQYRNLQEFALFCFRADFSSSSFFLMAKVFFIFSEEKRYVAFTRYFCGIGFYMHGTFNYSLCLFSCRWQEDIAARNTSITCLLPFLWQSIWSITRLKLVQVFPCSFLFFQLHLSLRKYLRMSGDFCVGVVLQVLTPFVVS